LVLPGDESVPSSSGDVFRFVLGDSPPSSGADAEESSSADAEELEGDEVSTVVGFDFSAGAPGMSIGGVTTVPTGVSAVAVDGGAAPDVDAKEADPDTGDGCCFLLTKSL